MQMMLMQLCQIMAICFVSDWLEWAVVKVLKTNNICNLQQEEIVKKPEHYLVARGLVG